MKATRLVWSGGFALVTAAGLLGSALGAGTGSAAGVESAVVASNLLANPGFSQVGPAGPYTNDLDADGGPVHWGQSAAARWNWYAASYHAISTDILPSTLPGHQNEKMLHVTTDAGGSDINQEFCPINGGPAHAQFSVWVYAVEGTVGAGVGNGGATGSHVFDSTPGKWVLLTGAESLSPANELGVSASPGSAGQGYVDFYVTAASVTGSNGPGCSAPAAG
jgi:hypothetical protein